MPLGFLVLAQAEEHVGQAAPPPHVGRGHDLAARGDRGAHGLERLVAPAPRPQRLGQPRRRVDRLLVRHAQRAALDLQRLAVEVGRLVPARLRVVQPRQAVQRKGHAHVLVAVGRHQHAQRLAVQRCRALKVAAHTVKLGQVVRGRAGVRVVGAKPLARELQRAAQQPLRGVKVALGHLFPAAVGEHAPLRRRQAPRGRGGVLARGVRRRGAVPDAGLGLRLGVGQHGVGGKARRAGCRAEKGAQCTAAGAIFLRLDRSLRCSYNPIRFLKTL